MAITPKQIEDAILTDLRAASTGAYYVERYEGPAGSADAMAEWIRRVQLPAVAVFCQGGERLDADEKERSVLRTGRFEVWVIHDKLRGYETAMVEPGGVYELLDALFARLQGSKVGIAALKTPLMWQREDHVATETESGRVVWAQVYETNFIR